MFSLPSGFQHLVILCNYLPHCDTLVSGSEMAPKGTSVGGLDAVCYALGRGSVKMAPASFCGPIP